MPDSFAEASSGLLLIANGMNTMLRWDGLTNTAEEAGVKAPKTAPSLAAATTSGGIVGNYYAYMRYIDRYGNKSNLSPISAKLEAKSVNGTVTGATNAVPIAITTSAAHGLLTGAKVKISEVTGNTVANDTWTVTVVTSTSFTLDGSAGSGDYRGGGKWLAGTDKITYSALETPSDRKVTRRQLLRSTDGQSTTFYVDLDTTDLSSSSLNSTKTDTALKTQTAVPLADADGGDLAISRFSVPPNHKSVLAHHLDRMFAAVDIEYRRGVVAVTLGSKTVTGIGTEWTEEMKGRFLFISGIELQIEIDSVDVINQTLTLKSAYLGNTDGYAAYGVVPATAERRLVYYSEAGLPEAWPPTNSFAVPPDGDELTGLMPRGSFLYVLERQHIYRFTFRSNPATDGYLFPVSNRGAINNRCWVIVEDTAYMLDEAGIHSFGGAESKPLSLTIRDMFGSQSGGKFRINWSASRYFHAVHSPAEEQIRWFVALSGSYLPRHALVYDFRQERWWIEEFAEPIGSSVRGFMARNPQIYLGGQHKRVLAFGAGPLDGPNQNGGTVRSKATSATRFTLSDTAAKFETGTALEGVPVVIVSGRGKGQMRLISEVVSGTKIAVTQPWLTTPDSTSVYQIGGVPWRWRGGWMRLEPTKGVTSRSVDLSFLPTATDATMDWRLRINHVEEAVPWAYDYDDGSIAVTARSSDVVVDLTDLLGQARAEFGGRVEGTAYGPKFVSFELAGVGGVDPVEVFELGAGGVG